MRFLFAATALLVLSCSDDGSGTATGSSSGSSSGVTLDVSTIFKGTLTLSGTITLPPGSGSGHSIQLTANGAMGSQVGLAGTTPGEKVPYTITGLGAGQYSVRARVDQNGDGNLSSPGDLDGFTGGTVDAPITELGKEKKVDVGASGATGVDFGLGKTP